jgi:enamine deaminase RidA (YjgF/YER057c/UK114 family)
MMERLRRAMSEVGADMSDMVKLNTFYLGNGTAEDWEVSAKIRADYFADPGPAATGIPLPSFPHKGLTTKICATAMLAQGEYSAPLSRKYIWPEGHWNWTAPLPYKHGNRAGQVIHIGGQVALDINAQVLHPDDMTAQTQIAMGNISRILEGFDATLNDLVKVTAFYQGGASAKDLHENLRLRSATFSETGPATTGIPVNNLVYEHMIIEIEAIAVLDI